MVRRYFGDVALKSIHFMTLILIFVSLFYNCEKISYHSGRDAYASFGNGRFQILRGYDVQRTLTLYDVEKQKTIVSRVRDHSKKQDKVFALGEDGIYTVLNYITGEYRQFNSINEAPAEIQIYLSKLDTKRFQLLPGYKREGNKLKRILVVYDWNVQKVIVEDVKDYAENGQFLYVLDDSSRYTYLNYETGKYQHYKTLDEVPAELRHHFVQLGNSLIVKIKKWL